MATKAELINMLRGMLADDDPTKNILNEGKQQYTDAKLEFFLNLALNDINNDAPQTSYSLEEFPDTSLLTIGAQIYAMMAEGTLQLRNQLDYNDAGFSISMFNKTGAYQGWAAFLLQIYDKNLMQFKRGVVPSRFGSGFLGIQSEFSRDYNW